MDFGMNLRVKESEIKSEETLDRLRDRERERITSEDLVSSSFEGVFESSEEEEEVFGSIMPIGCPLSPISASKWSNSNLASPPISI